MLLRLRIVAQIVDEIAPADVEHRADRDEGAEADVLAQAPVEHRRAQRAALADEADVPGLAIAAANVAFRPVTGLMTPRQLGPMMRIGPRRASSRTSRSSATPAARLLEARRDDDRACHRRRRTRGRCRHARRRRDDDGEIDRIGYGVDRGIRLDPEHAARCGLTGNTAPPNGVVVRFVISERPALPGVSLAPMSATAFGAKNGLSGRSSFSTWLGGFARAGTLSIMAMFTFFAPCATDQMRRHNAAASVRQPSRIPCVTNGRGAYATE